MPTIDLSAFKPVADTASDAALIDNAFDAIQTAINGGLDNNNIAASAGIVASKLAAPFGSYVPVWASTGTAVSPGNATIAGTYLQIGKLTVGQITLTMGSSTTYGTGTYTFTLPAAAVGVGSMPVGQAILFDNSASQIFSATPQLLSSTTVTLVSPSAPGVNAGPTAPFTFAVNDEALVNFCYQAS